MSSVLGGPFNPNGISARQAAANLSAQRNNFDPLSFMFGLGGAASGFGAAVPPMAASSLSRVAGATLRHRIGVEESPFGEAIIRSLDHPDELIRVHSTGDAVYPGFNMLSEEHRGTGLGSALYKRAIDWAQSKGLPFRSDGSLSSDAVRLYNSLKKQGYQVTEAPGTVRQDSGGMVNRHVGYVFEVKPPDQ